MPRRRSVSTRTQKTKLLNVFVSYSRLDRVVVERIVARLKGDGHDIWIDTAQLKPGDNIARAVDAGLAKADAMVVVVSRNSLKSRWIQQEFTAIALQQLSKGERRIIPV